MEGNNLIEFEKVKNKEAVAAQETPKQYAERMDALDKKFRNVSQENIDWNNIELEPLEADKSKKMEQDFHSKYADKLKQAVEKKSKLQRLPEIIEAKNKHMVQAIKKDIESLARKLSGLISRGKGGPTTSAV